MKIARSRNGFSLVELLTVIAIIAILAAIIFPVMSAVKNNAKRVQCITNMHDIALALSMFKNDNRRYPETLGGYVQYDTSGGAVIPMERTKSDPLHLSLYPEYIKSVRGFHCPLSSSTDTSAVTTLPVGGGFEYYGYDSYDVYTPNPGAYSATLLDLRYTVLWAPTQNDVTVYDGGTTDEEIALDYKRQLRFRQPSDDTVVTWCSFHKRAGDSRSMVPVLFLDGHSDLIPASKVEGSGTPGSRWRTMPKM